MLGASLVLGIVFLAGGVKRDVETWSVDRQRLASAITEAKARVRFCERCFNVSEGALCPICSDEGRDSSILCVVEESRDIVAVEKTGEFRGRYHVLLGAMSPLEGIGPDSRIALTFAVLFFDADLDGRLDLFQANGHLENEINRVHPSQTYAQPAQLFWNCGEACAQRFRQLDDTADLRNPMVGRGAAYADIDGDGDLDLAIVQNGRRAVLLRNDQQTGHHWLRLRLVGNAANRDGLGAEVTLRAAGMTQTRRVHPSRGYLSQVELPVTFGLGAATRVDELSVTWPGGRVQQVAVPRVDRMITITQEVAR